MFYCSSHRSLLSIRNFTVSLPECYVRCDSRKIYWFPSAPMIKLEEIHPQHYPNKMLGKRVWKNITTDRGTIVVSKGLIIPTHLLGSRDNGK